MKLVLFDIDGTLLRSGGAGRWAMERALIATFGTSGDPEYYYDGKTDKQIVRELMAGAGIPGSVVEEKMDELLAHYLVGLEEAVTMEQHKVQVFPGVIDLLDALAVTDGVMLGLLTGNIEAGARIKLKAAGIRFERFRINAFGSDSAHRPALPSIARRRAKELLDVELDGNRLIVIGDTPSDIECGMSIGALSIGVATGRFSMDELYKYSPHSLYQDLTDTWDLLETIKLA